MSKDKVEIDEKLQQRIKDTEDKTILGRQEDIRTELIKQRKEAEKLEELKEEAKRKRNQETFDAESQKTVTYWELVKKKAEHMGKSSFNTTISAMTAQMEMMEMTVLLSKALSSEGRLGALSYFINVSTDIVSDAWSRTAGRTETGYKIGQFVNALPEMAWEGFKSKVRGLVGLDPDGDFPELTFTASMDGGKLKTNFLVDGKAAGKDLQMNFDTALIAWIEQKKDMKFDPAAQAFSFVAAGDHLDPANSAGPRIPHNANDPVDEAVMKAVLAEATGNLNNEFQAYFERNLGLQVAPKGP